MNTNPQVTKMGAMSMQVCIPKDWNDERVKEFADHENLCGTEFGWQIRCEGSELLAGKPERNPCSIKTGYVHIMLDA